MRVCAVCVCVCDMKLYSIYMDAQDIGEPAKRKRNTHTHSISSAGIK